MAKKPSGDPILDEVLSSGDFASCMRIGCGDGGETILIPIILTRYIGISQSGAEFLASSIVQAQNAAGLFDALGPGGVIPLDAIPVIAGVSLPGTEGGRVVGVIHDEAGGEDGGPMSGFDLASTKDEMWTNEEWMDHIDEQMEEAIGQYPGADFAKTFGIAVARTRTIYGIYRTY